MMTYASQQLRPETVLLAIDDNADAHRIADILRAVGFGVQRVDNVTELDMEIGNLRVASPSERRADVLLCDEFLGGRSVMKLLAKKHLFVNTFPVVIMTGNRTPELVSIVRRLGVAGILKHPIESNLLQEAIRHAVVVKSTRIAG